MITMEDIIDKMFEEKEDFDEYMMMYKHCEDPVRKDIFYHIAEEESQHYYKLWGIVFKDVKDEHMTDKERGFKAYATEVYEKMVECLKKKAVK